MYIPNQPPAQYPITISNPDQPVFNWPSKIKTQKPFSTKNLDMLNMSNNAPLPLATIDQVPYNSNKILNSETNSNMTFYNYNSINRVTNNNNSIGQYDVSEKNNSSSRKA